MFQKIAPETLDQNVFDMIGKQWLLVCAQKEGKVNAMTASWGGMGVLWNKQVATIYIRPQRYTKEFIDDADTFSIMVFPAEQRSLLKYMGTVSGRDEDKVAHCKLTCNHIDETPYFQEASLTITCKKIYKQEMLPACFLDTAIEQKNYPQKDYHHMYIGEIIGIYKKTEDER